MPRDLTQSKISMMRIANKLPARKPNAKMRNDETGSEKALKYSMRLQINWHEDKPISNQRPIKQKQI